MSNRNVKCARLLPTLTALLLPALLLQACSGLLTSEQAAKQYYLLMPYEASAATNPSGTRREIELAVTAVPGLDTDHILALGTDARLNRYSNARWPDHLPEVLTSLLSRSLEATGRYATTDASVPRTGDWALQLEVRQFYGRQDADGATRSVLIELAGSLTCGEAGAPLRLTATEAVGEQRLSTIVAAHQAGLDSVTRDLLQLLERHCET